MSKTGNRSFSLPHWRWTRWLADPGSNIPTSIRTALASSLFATIPVFVGGVLNTVAVASVGYARVRTLPFLLWLLAELLLGVIRFAVQLWSIRLADKGRRTPTDLHMLLALCWAATVGFGAFLGITAGDWIVGLLACMSAAGMAGGMCFRNFAAPRYVCGMIVLSLGPICAGAIVSGQEALFLALLQIPIYAFAMTAAAFRLNGILVATMQSDQENAELARHDFLTGLLNRAGLEAEYRKITGRQFCLFYIDLDLFKAVNDLYGHAAGDEVLRSVADRIQSLLGPRACTARIGGDEFILMSGDLDDLAARRLAQRLVHEIGKRPFVLSSEDVVQVSLSIGVAIIEPGERLDFDAAVSLADRALYKAKEAGRSQFCFIASTTKVA